jgi:hypothetical protein
MNTHALAVCLNEKAKGRKCMSDSKTHVRCGTKGGSIFRIVFHSTPAKKGCALTSAVELRPKRVSGAVSMLRVGQKDQSTRASITCCAQICKRKLAYLRIISSASADNLGPSSAKVRLFRQSMIFLYVSWAFSEQNGGLEGRVYIE